MSGEHYSTEDAMGSGEEEVVLEFRGTIHISGPIILRHTRYSGRRRGRTERTATSPTSFSSKNNRGCNVAQEPMIECLPSPSKQSGACQIMPKKDKPLEVQDEECVPSTSRGLLPANRGVGNRKLCLPMGFREKAMRNRTALQNRTAPAPNHSGRLGNNTIPQLPSTPMLGNIAFPLGSNIPSGLVVKKEQTEEYYEHWGSDGNSSCFRISLDVLCPPGKSEMGQSNFEERPKVKTEDGPKVKTEDGKKNILEGQRKNDLVGLAPYVGTAGGGGSNRRTVSGGSSKGESKSRGMLIGPHDIATRQPSIVLGPVDSPLGEEKTRQKSQDSGVIEEKTGGSPEVASVNCGKIGASRPFDVGTLTGTVAPNVSKVAKPSFQRRTGYVTFEEYNKTTDDAGAKVTKMIKKKGETPPGSVRVSEWMDTLISPGDKKLRPICDDASMDSDNTSYFDNDLLEKMLDYPGPGYAGSLVSSSKSAEENNVLDVTDALEHTTEAVKAAKQCSNNVDPSFYLESLSEDPTPYTRPPLCIPLGPEDYVIKPVSVDLGRVSCSATRAYMDKLERMPKLALHGETLTGSLLGQYRVGHGSLVLFLALGSHNTSNAFFMPGRRLTHNRKGNELLHRLDDLLKKSFPLFETWVRQYVQEVNENTGLVPSCGPPYSFHSYGYRLHTFSLKGGFVDVYYSYRYLDHPPLSFVVHEKCTMPIDDDPTVACCEIRKVLLGLLDEASAGPSVGMVLESYVQADERGRLPCVKKPETYKEQVRPPVGNRDNVLSCIQLPDCVSSSSKSLLDKGQTVSKTAKRNARKLRLRRQLSRLLGTKNRSDKNDGKTG